MLLSPKTYKSLHLMEIFSAEIMIASSKGNPAVTIISCYSPTNVSEEEDKDQFYFDLRTATRSIPKHNITLAGGDMTARLGKKDARFGKKDAGCSAYNNVTNENGKRLLDYIQECRLQALNTRCRKRKGKLWSHTLPCGKKSQIDYILIDTKWKNVSGKVNHPPIKKSDTIGVNFLLIITSKNFIQWKSTTDSKYCKI